MSSVRWCGTAELTPLRSVRPSYRFLRPRSRENLSPAGTSHFPRPWGGHVRRTAPPDNNDIVLSQCFPAMSYVSVVGRACMALTMLQGHLTWQRMPFTWWFCHTNMSQMHLHDHVAYPARGILQSSGRGEFPHKRLRSYVLTCFHRKRLRSYVLTCFHQSGRRHGHLCNTLIIKYHLF